MTPVPRRRFGRTEIAMPVFSCGGMRYQQLWEDAGWDKIEEANQRNLETTIHRAIELGINHIETARGYGTSELQLGKILPTLPRESLIVQTKVAPAPAGEFLKTFDRSLELLGLEYVDLLAVHGINNDQLLDGILAKGGTLEAVRQIQREGRARFAGFSTHGPCDTIVRALATGEFDYVNLHWYWINQSNGPAIKEAAKQDAGVFIISPNDKGGKLYEPTAKLGECCAPLSPMAFNDLFCLLNPLVHTLSLGASKPSDFDEHVRTLDLLDRAGPLVAEAVVRLDAAIDAALGPQWRRHWQQGIPAWHEVPGEINLWEILRLWMYARAFDMVAFGKMRYNLLGNASHWFPGKNAASFDEAAILACVRHSPFADRIPAILREAHTLLHDEPASRLGRD
jgi:uncharacterized protein